MVTEPPQTVEIDPSISVPVRLAIRHSRLVQLPILGSPLIVPESYAPPKGAGVSADPDEEEDDEDEEDDDPELEPPVLEGEVGINTSVLF